MSDRRRGYRLTEEAGTDLKTIAAYIAMDRPSAGKRVLKALRDSFRTLARHPRIGTVCEHLGPGMRHFSSTSPAQRYVVLFRPVEVDVCVEIVAVIDSSRDWETLLGELGK